MLTLASVALAVGVALPLLPFYPGVACPLRALTGVPCPTCGMSGSVQSCLTLDLTSAMAQNPGGILVLAGAVAAFLLRPREVRVPLFLSVAVLSALWLYQLLRFDVIL